MSNIVPIDLSNLHLMERATERARNQCATRIIGDQWPETISDIAEHLAESGWPPDAVEQHMEELASHEPAPEPPDLDPPLSNARPRARRSPPRRHDFLTFREICHYRALALVELGPEEWAVVGTRDSEVITALESRRLSGITALESRRLSGIRVTYYASARDFAKRRPVEFVDTIPRDRPFNPRNAQ